MLIGWAWRRFVSTRWFGQLAATDVSNKYEKSSDSQNIQKWKIDVVTHVKRAVRSHIADRFVMQEGTTTEGTHEQQNEGLKKNRTDKQPAHLPLMAK
jgi:hypothetical protein